MNWHVLFSEIKKIRKNKNDTFGSAIFTDCEFPLAADKTFFQQKFIDTFSIFLIFL